jgi:betaine-aldehyde dehydrogenase
MPTLPAAPHQYEMLINGRWVEALSGKRYSRESPAHNVTVGTYPEADANDANAAVAAARRAFDEGTWPHLSGADRARCLLKVADLIRAHKEELAVIETLESGKPIAQARDEMEGCAGLWEYAATLCRHIYGDTYNTLGPDMIGLMFREPIGVVAMITPWNFPLLIISQKLPFALAAGCTAVVKPSELTPGTTLRLGQLIQQTDFPAGVVNIVTGYGLPVGARLAEHPDVDMMSFTGSTEVGKQIVGVSRHNLKKVELELGGKNPQIVFADADLDAALDAVVFGVYFNMGECCNSGSRLLVQRSIAEHFEAQIIAKAQTVLVGDPLNERTKVGAIVNAEQYGKIMDYITQGKQEGAALRLGGERLATLTGRFIQPTVFTGVAPAMSIAKEEIFGPVLSVIPFDTAEEALKIANSTMYGLSAGVWSRDIDTVFKMSRGIRAGTIWVNTFMDGYPELSFGGYKESGLGRELGRFAIDEFTELKTVQMHLGPRTNWWLK